MSRPCLSRRYLTPGTDPGHGVTVYPSMVLKREADGKVQWKRITIRKLGSPTPDNRSEAQITGGASANGFPVHGVGMVYPFLNQPQGPSAPE